MEGPVKERWLELCELITKEQDSQKLSALTEELNRLLEKEQRLQATRSTVATLMRGGGRQHIVRA